MAMPKPRPGSLGHQVARGLAQTHVFWYRLTGGRIGGSMGGVKMLLLTTQGRKSGRKRTLPLLYLKTSKGYALVASYGGSDRHPSWYLNLVANPDVEIQVDDRSLPAQAETVSAERRVELWPRLVEVYSDYQVYQDRTEREIPLVELTPTTPA